MIRSTAASEVQHISGSYAAVAPGTNLRPGAFCLFKPPVTLKLVLGSSPWIPSIGIVTSEWIVSLEFVFSFWLQTTSFYLFDSDELQWGLHLLTINMYWHIGRPDPNGILAFAVQQLQIAENGGQRAWIIAHMPPSSPDALHDQVWVFLFGCSFI